MDHVQRKGCGQKEGRKGERKTEGEREKEKDREKEKEGGYRIVGKEKESDGKICAPVYYRSEVILSRAPGKSY